MRIVRYGLPAVLREMDLIYTEALNEQGDKVDSTEMLTAISGDS